MKYGRVAQVVEHLTFNQVVRGSNPRTLMMKEWRKPSIYKGFRYFYVNFKVRIKICLHCVKDVLK